MMTFVLGIDKQGVKQLKALLRFTPPAGSQRRQLDCFGIDADGVLATDTFALALAGVNSGIRWHSDPPAGTLAVNGKGLIGMLPADGATVTFEGNMMTVSAPQYEAQGVIDADHWMNWRAIVPQVDEDAPLYPVGAFNPAILGKFAPLADALNGKRNQAIHLHAYHEAHEVKPMIVRREDRSFLGLLMPMRIG
jgi:hypothetical protein